MSKIELPVNVTMSRFLLVISFSLFLDVCLALSVLNRNISGSNLAQQGCSSYSPLNEAKYSKLASIVTVVHLVIPEGQEAIVDCTNPNLEDKNVELTKLGYWMIRKTSENDTGIYSCKRGAKEIYVDLFVVRNGSNIDPMKWEENSPKWLIKSRIGSLIKMTCPLFTPTNEVIYWDTLLYQRNLVNGVVNSQGEWLLTDKKYPTFACRNLETGQVGIVQISVFESLQDLYFDMVPDGTQYFETLSSHAWAKSRQFNKSPKDRMCRECGPVIPDTNSLWSEHFFAATDTLGAIFYNWLPECCRASDFLALSQIVNQKLSAVELATSYDFPEYFTCPPSSNVTITSQFELCKFSTPLGYCGKSRGRKGCGATVALEMYRPKQDHGRVKYWSVKMKEKRPSANDFEFVKVLCYLWNV